MKIEEEYETGNATPAALETLRETREEARGSAPPRGLLGKVRHGVWSAWLWLLVWMAEASWKRWLLVLGLLAFGYVVFLANPIEESPEYGLDHDFGIESEEFIASIVGATDTPFAPGNRIDIYNNGDEFYPPMLAEIEEAKKTITVEAYIYWQGEIGMRFARALADKARSGLTVKILLDAVGSSTISDEIMARSSRAAARS